MNEPQEPMRWDADESDAPEELKRALAALAVADRPQTAELQRVRRRLQAVFEAASPLRLRWLHAFGGSLEMLAIGLVFIGGLFGWFHYERGQLAPPEQPCCAVEGSRSSREEFAATRSLRAPVESGAADETMNAALGEVTVAPALAAVSGGADSAVAHSREGLAAVRGTAMRVPARTGARGGARGRAHGEGANRAGARDDVRAEAPSSDVTTHEVDDRASELAATAPDDSSVSPPADSVSVAVPVSEPRSESLGRASAAAPAVSPRVPAADGGNAALVDEAILLQRARSAANANPEAALRLLEEHKRLFPTGMLSPEREVFAIDLLRSLSRTHEADRRARDFRRDYPKSVYLSRIQP